MARRARSRDKGPLWYGYRRPVWRDGVFWLAVGTTIAGLLVQNAFGDFEATTSGWVILALEVVITTLIVFALIGVLAATLRGFGEGWRQADKAAPARTAAPTSVVPPEVAAEVAEVEPEVPATPPTAEVAAEPAPAEVPSEPETEPAPETEPTPAPAATADPDRPKAGVEMERQARRLGRAIGAGRRTYKKYDKG